MKRLVAGLAALLAAATVAACGVSVPLFSCNGTTGVYNSADGSTVTTQSNDPKCS